jgi:ribosomal protein S21
MDGAFDNALKRFRESLTKGQREQFAHCKKQDVQRTIQDIQTRHGSQRSLKNMRRVSKFIEGMSQLSQVIEVFLNVNNSVAFVWVRAQMPIA